MITRRRGFLGFAAATLGGPALAAPRGNGRRSAPPPNITIETHRGKLRGAADDGIKVFKGIPYAATTDGLNRFRPPKPAKTWPDIRDALAYGPMCPQVDRERGSYTASWTYD